MSRKRSTDHILSGSVTLMNVTLINVTLILTCFMTCDQNHQTMPISFRRCALSKTGNTIAKFTLQ